MSLNESKYAIVFLIIGIVMGMVIKFGFLKVWAEQDAYKYEAKNFTCQVIYKREQP
jgi:hypothetical protein